MITKSIGTASEKKNCVICHHRTPEYIEFSEKNGISIRIPCCGKCQNKIGLYLIGPMKLALASIRTSVVASMFITEDEKTIRELQIKKAGDSNA